MKTTFLRAIALGCMGIAMAHAQQEPTFSVDVRQVYLPFLPIARGKVVEGITVEHVRVFENNIEQKVLDVTRYTQHPIALAIMLDSTESMRSHHSKSGSRRDKLEIARNAAKDLLRSLFRPGKDIGLVAEFFLDGYSPIPYINQDWTDNLGRLERGIADINYASGATPVRDAAYNLAEKFAGIKGTYLRVAVILSDGLDTEHNAHTLAETVTQLQHCQVLTYGIGMYKERPQQKQKKNPPDVLKKIAEETGGVMIFETQLEQIAKTFQRIGNTIRNMYFLNYTPVSDAEGRRNIRMEIGSRNPRDGTWQKKSAVVFHRKGYAYTKQP